MGFPPPAPETRHTGQTQNLSGFEKYLRTLRTRNGYLLSETTIRSKIRRIKALNNSVNLWDTEAVEHYLENSNLSGGTKVNYSVAYKNWCESKGFEYKRKKYRRKEKLPYIPTEKDIDQLIGGFLNSKYGAYIQLIKETAFRPIEASRLKPIDFDLNRKIVTLNDPAKNSNPRQVKISDKAISMLIPLMNKTKPNELLWDSKPRNICETIRRHRLKVAQRLGNPNLNRITLKTLRHWKATIEYHRTKDILYVKELLGHKNIKNTLVYTHLVAFEENDQFIVKVAKTLEEFTELLELGFEYVSEYEGMKVLRKRK